MEPRGAQNCVFEAGKELSCSQDGCRVFGDTTYRAADTKIDAALQRDTTAPFTDAATYAKVVQEVFRPNGIMSTDVTASCYLYISLKCRRGVRPKSLPSQDTEVGRQSGRSRG